ncbi:glycoside hydrolase family 88 protein [Flavobacterium gilvum]|uniref:Glucuronyl hydrolase n=1 Tax=Flavobacterium gilvum TaxID=1492737 RepID=A0AAC9N5N2_9FLAO|nr:glycoside hydrolase family 88 protein [Flavobacterium gilvum]AOW08579.1 glucuronyl hydrolase [Flavobacterium gilvum]KFC58430.1 glycoside hydrolase [Flavobacterium gilvum]
MKRVKYYLVLLSLSGLSVFAQKDNSKDHFAMQKLIHDNFAFAEKQYQYLEKATPQDSMPKTFEHNKNVSSNVWWWCSGFYPGTLLYIYEYTKKPLILDEAKKRLAILDTVKYYTKNHDLGFMMYCSFGNAYRLTKNEEYKKVILQSSKSLATRYRPDAKVIQSWEVTEGALKQKGFAGPVIIDNMMNLEMLEWASHNSNDPTFADIAENHANTTIKNHFRPDYSSYHVLDYDLKTGQVLKKVTAQGYADSSAWSRGQGWALYGYTMMYRFTKNPAYLKQAQGIAKFILNNPNLPADKVPYWDFDAPNIPNALRDASAGALYASALLELGQYTSGKEKQNYVDVAKTILKSLSTPKYRAKLGSNGGYLLMHSVGSIPHNGEIDVPLTYADYYFLEALLRYKKWYL